MSVSHMSPSWTRIQVQIRFHRVYIVIKYMAYTKPSWSRTSVVLLVKLEDPAYPGPYQGPTSNFSHPPNPHHVWHAPLGATHAWGVRTPRRRRIGLLVGSKLGPELGDRGAGARARVWGLLGGIRTPSNTRIPLSGQPS